MSAGGETHGGRAAIEAWLDGGPAPERAVLKAAVRESLAELARCVPGRSVEVRVPPYGAVQCVEGPRHGRGTPPNVVEADARTWLALVTGRTAWAAALASGTLLASGGRTAAVAAVLPLRGTARAHR